jgi:hypothetical protein
LVQQPIRRLDAEKPAQQAIRLFLDFMRIGDLESAYQAVEKMKFGDFVDALEAVRAKEKSPKAPQEKATPKRPALTDGGH